jgi:hypothetical protein
MSFLQSKSLEVAIRCAERKQKEKQVTDELAELFGELSPQSPLVHRSGGPQFALDDDTTLGPLRSAHRSRAR